MINGINFITQKVDYKSLREILLTANAEEYYWCVGDSDVYEMPPRKNILPKGIYSGASILEKDIPTALKIVSSESLLNLSNVNNEPSRSPTGKALPKIFGSS